MEITDRDYDILRLVYRFKFCFGRHIKVLCDFTGARACDRRLKLLVDAGYLTRKKIIYGFPYLYTLSHKGRILLGFNKREIKIRVDLIRHDSIVLDTLIYFVSKYNLNIRNIESERELHIKDGFSMRKHHPDFMFAIDDMKYAVEIELSVKNKAILEKNVRENYMNYDKQIWIVENKKALTMIENFKNEYSNIDIIRLEEVLKHDEVGD